MFTGMENRDFPCCNARKKKETFYSSKPSLFPMDLWFGVCFLAPQNKDKKLLLKSTEVVSLNTKILKTWSAVVLLSFELSPFH